MHSLSVLQFVICLCVEWVCCITALVCHTWLCGALWQADQTTEGGLMQLREDGRVCVAGKRCGSEGAAGKGCGGAGDRALQDHRGLH